MEFNRNTNNRKNRRNSIARRLARMETRLEVMQCDLNRVITLIMQERAAREQERENRVDEAITKMHAAAVRMEEQWKRDVRLMARGV